MAVPNVNANEVEVEKVGVEVGEVFFPRTNLFLANLDGSVCVLKKRLLNKTIQKERFVTLKPNQKTPGLLYVLHVVFLGFLGSCKLQLQTFSSFNSKAKNGGPSMSSQ